MNGLTEETLISQILDQNINLNLNIDKIKLLELSVKYLTNLPCNGSKMERRHALIRSKHHVRKW